MSQPHAKHELDPPAPGGLASPWVRLRSAAAHPFLYQRMLREADPAARPGDVVNVYDRHGALFGRGLFNPRSQIALRMLAYGDRPIDDAFWEQRLRDAIELRERLGLAATTDAYRLVHAEGDALSGLIVERYADTLVFEMFALGMFQRSELIAGLLRRLLSPPSSLDRPQPPPEGWRVIVRADARSAQLEGFREPPPPDDANRRLIVREHGVRYRVDPAGGHKTGFFCDQRDNRRRLAGYCRDANVLDICCYSGGFALCAKLLGAAHEVTAVDLHEDAVALARENANLNQTRINTVHADGFIYLRQMLATGRQFDVVVLDPPKFAPTRADLDAALRKYHDMNHLAAQALRPGGVLLTCSCSGLVAPGVFLHTVHDAIRRAGKRAQLLELCGAAPDHPVALDCPETAYLKAAFLRVRE